MNVTIPVYTLFGIACLENCAKAIYSGAIGYIAGHVFETKPLFFAKVIALSSLAHNTLILLSEIFFLKKKSIGSSVRLLINLTGYIITGIALYRLGLITPLGLAVYSAFSIIYININPTGRAFSVIKLHANDDLDHLPPSLKRVVNIIKSLNNDVLLIFSRIFLYC